MGLVFSFGGSRWDAASNVLHIFFKIQPDVFIFGFCSGWDVKGDFARLTKRTVFSACTGNVGWRGRLAIYVGNVVTILECIGSDVTYSGGYIDRSEVFAFIKRGFAYTHNGVFLSTRMVGLYSGWNVVLSGWFCFTFEA